MKKSILFMSAVAMLAAASCNKPELENIDKAPELGAKEFVAYTEAPTKTQLNGLATEWEEGDVIDINGVPFVTNETGTKAIFKIDDDNSEFPEAPYIAGYPYNIVYGDANGNICFDFRNEHLLVKGEICDEVLAVAYSESDRTLEFNNVTSLVKFTIPEFAEQIDVITFSTNEQLAGDVVINLDDFSWSPVVGDDASSYNEIVVKSSEGFTPGETYYVPVLPGKKTNLTVKINNTVVATGISIEFKRNIIHNISTLPSAEVRTVYLKPGVWAADNAWFAAHFFGAADVDTKMVDSDEDGIYEVAVPNGATGVIFCRMNPDFTDFEWNKEDEEIKHVWDQTADLTVPAVDAAEIYYVVSDWAAGAWKTYEDATAEPEIVVEYWAVAGSFNGWSTTASKMTLVEDWYVIDDVKLMAEDQFKMCADGGWDVCRGAEGNNDGVNIELGVETTVVDPGKNFAIADGGFYSIYLNKAANKVKVVKTGELPVVSVPDQPSDWALAGTFNSWADKQMLTTNVPDLFVAKNVTLSAYDRFKIKKMAEGTDDGWSLNYGTANINYLNSNIWIAVGDGAGDIFIVSAGNYDVYFDLSNKKLYLMDAGTDYSSAIEQTVSGDAPVVETGTKIYLKPNSNWKSDNARFAVYTWDGGDQWFDMKKSDSDGIYEVLIPEGVSNIIFCRMNPNATANNWNNKWNQSSDLKVQTDGKNLYTVKDGTWDKGGGVWSVK